MNELLYIREFYFSDMNIEEKENKTKKENSLGLLLDSWYELHKILYGK